MCPGVLRSFPYCQHRTEAPTLQYPAFAPQVKKAEWFPLMDVKIRDLMITAAAALRDGGSLVLAHEIRGDMKEVLGLMERVSYIFCFGGATLDFDRAGEYCCVLVLCCYRCRCCCLCCCLLMAVDHFFTTNRGI